MVFVIIVAIIIYLGFSGSQKPKSRSRKNYATPSQKSYPKITVEIKRSSPQNDSTIDVTGKSYKLDSSVVKPPLKRVTQGVPYWQHHYVYSYSEIKAAGREQQAFYRFFKESFLKGIYFDLEGNTNYAFILFFDLLDEFLQHKDQTKIESQLELLGQCYPKTSGYAIPELIKRLGMLGDNAAIQELRSKQQTQYHQYSDYDEWRLGTKYMSKLKLSASDVKLLNKVWQPSNNFGGIEFCCIQIMKLYLKTISELNVEYNQENSTLDEQFNIIADLVARRHFNYRTNSTNYKYSIDQIKGELYSTIFKICENTIREVYEHKRKLSTDFYPNTSAIQSAFQIRILSKVEVIHLKLTSTIVPPDKSTEEELNMQNTSRWKEKFENMSRDFNGDSKTFKANVEILASLNRKNPSIENIFFEASKFIANRDKPLSLLFYIHYIDSDLKSAKIDNKQLTKTVQKSLFESPEQLRDFEKIVNDLISTKDLNKAVEAVSQFYVAKRKKINLNRDAITQAREKHSETVELLNEYLKDGDEEVMNPVTAVTEDNDEVQIEIRESDASQSNSKSRFTDIQQAFLDYFQKNGLTLTIQEVDSFTKSRGILKNQLIESVNETCYEILDDVLIEEDGNVFSVNSEYFQRILTL